MIGVIANNKKSKLLMKLKKELVIDNTNKGENLWQFYRKHTQRLLLFLV